MDALDPPAAPRDTGPPADSPVVPPRASPPKALGGYAWFDIGTRLAILALGLIMLAAGQAPVAGLAPATLVSGYLVATLLSIGGTLPAVHARLAARRLWRPLTPGEHLALTVLVDSAFVVGVAALSVRPEASLLLVMVILAGTRACAWVLGRLSPLMALPFVLPLLILAVRAAGLLRTPTADPAPLIEAVLTLCLLAMIFAFLRTLNQALVEGAVPLTAGGAQQEPQPPQSWRDLEEARRREEQVVRLEALQDGIRAMNSAMALDDLLQMVVANAVRVLKAEQSSIGLLDEPAGELVIQAATGVAASTLRRQRFAPGVGVAGWVLQHGEALNIGDVRFDSRYVATSGTPPSGQSTRSILCVPMRAERQVIGTLTVTHSRPFALTDDDQRLLSQFAEQVAFAVHKTRLLEERTRQSDELRRRGELLAGLMSLRQAVLSSLDLTQVLNTTITRVSELIRFDRGLIYLLEPGTGEAGVVATSGAGGAPRDELALRPGTRAMQLWEQARTADSAVSCEDDLSLLLVPLAKRGDVLGCILLARNDGSPFTDVERSVAAQLAGTATIAVDNARLFSSLSLQQQQTAALYRLMLKVSDAPNRRQLAQVVCEEIQQITGAQGAALLINDMAQGHFTAWAASGVWQERQDVQALTVPGHGDPFVSHMLAMLHQHNAQDLLYVPTIPAQARQVFAGDGCITLPLTLAGRIYGLLVLQPGADPPIADDIKETVNLALSHCTIALERTELFEQTLAAARQSGMLHSIASEVQSSLDPSRVLQTTAHGVLTALPVHSCEIYLFDAARTTLQRTGMAATPNLAGGAPSGLWRPGPESVSVDDNSSLLEVLHSPGLIAGDLDGAEPPPEGTVLLGRLMGSEEALGIVRLTTALAADEFVRRYGTFSQTLWMHSGGALERSHLYTTAASQAHTLRERAQQLTDILTLGNLSTADMPLGTLLPRIAAGIARSLGFAHVQIGALDPELRAPARPLEEPAPSTGAAHAVRAAALSPGALARLMATGEPIEPDFVGVTLDESCLTQVLGPDLAPLPSAAARRFLLMPLDATGGDTIGYLLAAPGSAAPVPDHELLEVLSIFAQRVALILENHRVYNELLTSMRKQEAVVLSISDGVIVTDGELNVMITNSLADQLLGVTPDASKGTPLSRFISNADLVAQLEDCLHTGKSNAADVDLPLGRESRTYQAVVHPMAAPDAGGSLGVVLTLRDVTLERATERAKSDFLSIVSHELRTPLNSIMGFLEIILMGKTGPLNDLQKDFLGTAKQESVALQRLINDVLDYSQVNSRMLRLEKVPMNLSAVITRVVNQAVPRMVQDELELVSNMPPQVLVVGDEVRLEQVYKNLLDNAAKFTEPKGRIFFDAALTETTITISVRDTGCGIPPAQLPNVFERFFQAENHSSRRKRGLGLGLAICKSIIEAHDGRIWIESEVDVGTTVHVQLPLFDRQAPAWLNETAAIIG